MKIRKRIKQKNKRTRRPNRKIKTSIDKSNHPKKTKCLKQIAKKILLTLINIALNQKKQTIRKKEKKHLLLTL